jgi:hypothetical protein
MPSRELHARGAASGRTTASWKPSIGSFVVTTNPEREPCRACPHRAVDAPGRIRTSRMDGPAGIALSDYVGPYRTDRQKARRVKRSARGTVGGGVVPKRCQAADIREGWVPSLGSKDRGLLRLPQTLGRLVDRPSWCMSSVASLARSDRRLPHPRLTAIMRPWDR